MRIVDERAELDDLLLKQAETLKAEKLGDISVDELFEYERRYARILELCGKILGTKDLDA